MILFPLATICEMIFETNSHNLFPIEIMIYAIFTIPAILGAGAFQVINRTAIKKKVKTHCYIKHL